MLPHLYLYLARLLCRLPLFLSHFWSYLSLKYKMYTNTLVWQAEKTIHDINFYWQGIVTQSDIGWQLWFLPGITLKQILYSKSQLRLGSWYKQDFGPPSRRRPYEPEIQSGRSSFGLEALTQRYMRTKGMPSKLPHMRPWITRSNRRKTY